MTAGRLIAALVAALAVPTGAVSAEGFIDLALGAAFTQDAVLVGDSAGFVVASPTAFEPSVSIGLRGGYWFESFPWLGLAADLSYFAPHEDFGGEAAKIRVVPLSFLLALRVPLLRSERIPQGRVQPYGAIGPGVFISTAQLEVPGFDDFQSVTADVGLDVHVGVEVQILRWLGVFLEYRHTRFAPAWTDRVADFPVELSTQLSSHHLLVGAGFHF